MSMLREFRDFAVEGNVFGLGVCVILGTAVGKVVASLVADLNMPIVGALIGGIHYENLFIQVGEAKIMYGKFLENVVDFFIIALVIFFLVKAINHFRRQSEKEPAAAPPPREVQLLEEIRDLLKKKTIS